MELLGELPGEQRRERCAELLGKLPVELPRPWLGRQSVERRR